MLKPEDPSWPLKSIHHAERRGVIRLRPEDAAHHACVSVSGYLRHYHAVLVAPHVTVTFPAHHFFGYELVYINF
jgi:hypothetical protein